MAVYNLGSINVDHVYHVPHLPEPGETLAAMSVKTGLGGKGANQSVAAARGGAEVFHIGGVGQADTFALGAMQHFGVDVRHVSKVDAPTGHAIINVDPNGENAIVICGGANLGLNQQTVAQALAGGHRGDILLLQNETNLQLGAAQLAHEKGMRVFYSAAPFDVRAVQAVLGHIDVLVMNEGEAAQLAHHIRTGLTCEMIVTRGGKGATWAVPGEEDINQPAFSVTPVDTTGAGDCFIGSVAAALASGASRKEAMRYASAAAAIQVTREGAAEAMPTQQEVLAFLAG